MEITGWRQGAQHGRGKQWACPPALSTPSSTDLICMLVMGRQRYKMLGSIPQAWLDVFHGGQRCKGVRPSESYHFSFPMFWRSSVCMRTIRCCHPLSFSWIVYVLLFPFPAWSMTFWFPSVFVSANHTRLCSIFLIHCLEFLFYLQLLIPVWF